MKKALIIIDLQKGFINKLTSKLPNKIKEYFQSHSSDFDLILFTQYKNHQDSPLAKTLDYHEFSTPEEYDIVDELKEFITSHNLFTKDTYSSFVDEKLHNTLKENNIEEVYLMGIMTENCVLTFARDAVDRGFFVTVLKDYCGTITNLEKHNAALKIISDNIGKVK